MVGGAGSNIIWLHAAPPHGALHSHTASVHAPLSEQSKSVEQASATAAAAAAAASAIRDARIPAKD
jgi:hypothetical protein